jgi:hypothetical protein
MIDVYPLFAEMDRVRAQALVQLLVGAGWTVSWPEAEPGQEFRRIPEEELRDARHVVVLWSVHSASSDGIKEEARLARDKLIQVRIDAVEVPREFRGTKSEDLAGWDGSPDDLRVRRFVQYLCARRAFEEVVLQKMSASPDAVKEVSRQLDISREALMKKLREFLPAAEPPCEAVRPEPVLFGVAAPRTAQPGSSFTARFATYIAAAKAAAQEHLEALGEKDDRIVLDIPPDRQPHWRIGAPVTVRLTGEHVTISPAEREFEWNGRENLASFVVKVDADASCGTTQVCFHVFLGQVQIAFIPMSVEIGAQAGGAQEPRLDVLAPSSAFASYASKDAQAVTQRLSTLVRWAPTLDIFQDCLDLKANAAFKPQLAREIAAREVFLLFWSRHASGSEWVRWEFETAKVRPGIDAVLPMPLEDPTVAPPPPGLEDKHLRDRFMIAGYGLQKIAETIRGA